MSVAFAQIYSDLCNWGKLHAINVVNKTLPVDKAGEFTGSSVVMNIEYDIEQRSYYLAHALGSIARWSLNRSEVQSIFDNLRMAKQRHSKSPADLDAAIARFRDFETEVSEYAVWLLARLGHSDAISSYTNFMRCDLEAMTEFHRQGKAPVWRTFFEQWNREVTCGRKTVAPFSRKPIPRFAPVDIEPQEILQSQ